MQCTEQRTKCTEENMLINQNHSGETSNDNLNAWDERSTCYYIKYLLEITMSEKIAELKNMLIPDVVWSKMATKMSTNKRYLKNIWKIKFYMFMEQPSMQKRTKIMNRFLQDYLLTSYNKYVKLKKLVIHRIPIDYEIEVLENWFDEESLLSSANVHESYSKKTKKKISAKKSITNKSDKTRNDEKFNNQPVVKSQSCTPTELNTPQALYELKEDKGVTTCLPSNRNLPQIIREEIIETKYRIFCNVRPQEQPLPQLTTNEHKIDFSVKLKDTNKNDVQEEHDTFIDCPEVQDQFSSTEDIDGNDIKQLTSIKSDFSDERIEESTVQKLQQSKPMESYTDTCSSNDVEVLNNQQTKKKNKYLGLLDKQIDDDSKDLQSDDDSKSDVQEEYDSLIDCPESHDQISSPENADLKFRLQLSIEESDFIDNELHDEEMDTYQVNDKSALQILKESYNDSSPKCNIDLEDEDERIDETTLLKLQQLKRLDLYAEISCSDDNDEVSNHHQLEKESNNMNSPERHVDPTSNEIKSDDTNKSNLREECDPFIGVPESQDHFTSPENIDVQDRSPLSCEESDVTDDKMDGEEIDTYQMNDKSALLILTESYNDSSPKCKIGLVDEDVSIDETTLLKLQLLKRLDLYAEMSSSDDNDEEVSNHDQLEEESNKMNSPERHVDPTSKEIKSDDTNKSDGQEERVPFIGVPESQDLFTSPENINVKDGLPLTSDESNFTDNEMNAEISSSDNNDEEVSNRDQLEKENRDMNSPERHVDHIANKLQSDVRNKSDSQEEHVPFIGVPESQDLFTSPEITDIKDRLSLSYEKSDIVKSEMDLEEIVSHRINGKSVVKCLTETFDFNRLKCKIIDVVDKLKSVIDDVNNIECEIAKINEDKSADSNIKQISQLIKKENLKKYEHPSSIKLHTLSEDDEIWIIEGPKTIFNKSLEGKKMIFKSESELKFGIDSYKIINKNISSLPCIFDKGEKKADFGIVNVRPVKSFAISEQDVSSKSHYSNTFSKEIPVSEVKMQNNMIGVSHEFEGKTENKALLFDGDVISSTKLASLTAYKSKNKKNLMDTDEEDNNKNDVKKISVFEGETGYETSSPMQKIKHKKKMQKKLDYEESVNDSNILYKSHCEFLKKSNLSSNRLEANLTLENLEIVNYIRKLENNIKCSENCKETLNVSLLGTSLYNLQSKNEIMNKNKTIKKLKRQKKKNKWCLTNFVKVGECENGLENAATYSTMNHFKRCSSEEKDKVIFTNKMHVTKRKMSERFNDDVPAKMVKNFHSPKKQIPVNENMQNSKNRLEICKRKNEIISSKHAIFGPCVTEGRKFLKEIDNNLLPDKKARPLEGELKLGIECENKSNIKDFLNKNKNETTFLKHQKRKILKTAKNISVKSRVSKYSLNRPRNLKKRHVQEDTTQEIEDSSSEN